MTHLDRYTPDQRAALDLLRETVRKFSTAEMDKVAVSDPHALARGLLDARTIVASDPEVLHEAGRQMYTQFDLAPYDERKRNAVLSAYHDDAQMAQWTVIALKWIAQVAMALADRAPPTMH